MSKILRPYGEWINYDGYECGEGFEATCCTDYEYCPCCGAKMFISEEVEDDIRRGW